MMREIIAEHYFQRKIDTERERERKEPIKLNEIVNSWNGKERLLLKIADPSENKDTSSDGRWS